MEREFKTQVTPPTLGSDVCICGHNAFKHKNTALYIGTGDCILCECSGGNYPKQPKNTTLAKQFFDTAINLEIMAEECAEVIQIKSKIVRFGIDDIYPIRGHSNRIALEQELGHLFAMVDILIEHGVITQIGIDEGKKHKIDKLAKWYP